MWQWRLVVLGLIGFALYRSDLIVPKGEEADQAGTSRGIDPAKLAWEATRPRDETNVRNPDHGEGVRVCSQLLGFPEVKGTAAYKPMEDNTVRFALNVWAGWAPIIYANDGFAANKVWKTPDWKGIPGRTGADRRPGRHAGRLSPAAKSTSAGQRSTCCRCSWSGSWMQTANRATAASCLVSTSKSTGRVAATESSSVQNIRTVADLRGKKIVLAESSPSHYFALNMLVAGGVQPSEVEMIFTPTPFKLPRPSMRRKTSAAAVSWAPDIYNLEKVQGNRCWSPRPRPTS